MTRPLHSPALPLLAYSEAVHLIKVRWTVHACTGMVHTGRQAWLRPDDPRPVGQGVSRNISLPATSDTENSAAVEPPQSQICRPWCVPASCDLVFCVAISARSSALLAALQQCARKMFTQPQHHVWLCTKQSPTHLLS